MQRPGYFALGALCRLFEVTCIAQNKYDPMFSSVVFNILLVSQWIWSVLFVSALWTYIIVEPNDPQNVHLKLKSFAISISGVHFAVVQMILWSRRKLVNELLESLREVLETVEGDGKYGKYFMIADSRSRKFITGFGTLILINIPYGMLLAAIFTLNTGKLSYPFEMSTFGLPVALGWAFQGCCALNTCLLIFGVYASLKVLIYFTDACSNALALMLRDRPTIFDEKNDKKILKLFCDIGRVKILMSTILGPIMYIEVVVSSLRCCVASYHSITSISKKDYKSVGAASNTMMTSIVMTYVVTACGAQFEDQTAAIDEGIMESKWYESGPAARKAIIPLMTLNQRPIQLHYKRFKYFNMETFFNVVQTAYTMTTALSNFI